MKRHMRSYLLVSTFDKAPAAPIMAVMSVLLKAVVLLVWRQRPAIVCGEGCGMRLLGGQVVEEEERERRTARTGASEDA
jgi:hypothetical protein